MIQPTYAHVVRAERPTRFPTRFAAMEALLGTITGAGAVIERRDIPTDSGLEAIGVFSEAGDDEFMVMRINEHTFTITRRARGKC